MTTAARDWRLELGRKAIHLSTFVFPVWIALAPDPLRHRGLLLAFVAILTTDLLRLHWPRFGRLVHARVGAYLRPTERQRPISVHYLTFAALVLAWIASRPIAATALGFLVLGDAAAAVVGERWGRHRWGRKSVEGSVACFAGCVAAGALFMPHHLGAVLVAAAVATTVEAIPARVNDNLSVPFMSAMTLWLLV
jgi:dolichol kinase